MPKLKTRRTKIRRLIFNAMFVLSLLIIMVYVSFSWFVSSKQAEVSGITMNVAKGTELTIKTEEFPDGIKSLDINFNKDYPLDSLAGNGQYFYTPEIGFPEVDSDSTQGSTVSKKDVIGYIPVEKLNTVEDYLNIGAFAMDFSLHIEKDTEVYLYASEEGDGSFVIPAPESDYKDENNKSPYGDFDVGLISGAVRIAFLQKNDAGVYVPTFIWAPNSSIELGFDENGQIFVNDNSANYEEKYLFMGADEAKIEINTNSTAQGVDDTTTENVIYAWGDISEKQRIGTLTAGEANYFRLVVWVDGHDRECHNALLSGLICIGLKIGT